ncbi:MAG: tRNA (cytidine(34)-2'-O)-methyltransferase [Pseudomonadota bacterium]
MLRLALYQPDIPQNTGTLLRLGACLGVAVDIIEPCGFVMHDKALRRAGLDYLELAAIHRHDSWTAFLVDLDQRRGRLILLTTRAPLSYTAFRFQPGDTLLLGRESAGVPGEVHARADARLTIPMVAGRRSINVAAAGAMAAGEALRQLGGFPAIETTGAGEA